MEPYEVIAWLALACLAAAGVFLAIDRHDTGRRAQAEDAAWERVAADIKAQREARKHSRRR